MAEKISTRQAYGDTLVQLGGENPDIIVFDADLSKSTMTAGFREAYPNRFFNAGIAEANMMGMAAGLALSGKTVFASTFAMFAAGRAYEIIRNSIGYPRANVKICATHAGITVGEDGASHQCVEDLALMSVIPGMMVVHPADGISAEKLLRQIASVDGPVYVRLGRLAVPIVYGKDTEIVLGRANTLREGTDHTVIACGIMVDEALQAADILEDEGIHIRVLDMHTIKPIDEDAIIKAARETKSIITAEEHSVIGGLGSAVASVTARRCPARVTMVGVQDKFGKSGKPDELKKAYHLTADDIVQAVRDADAEIGK